MITEYEKKQNAIVDQMMGEVEIEYLIHRYGEKQARTLALLILGALVGAGFKVERLQ